MSRCPVKFFRSEEDAGFIAEAHDLPGCSAWGATESDAACEAQVAVAAWVQDARAAGKAAPMPQVMRSGPRSAWLQHRISALAGLLRQPGHDAVGSAGDS